MERRLLEAAKGFFRDLMKVKGKTGGPATFAHVSGGGWCGVWWRGGGCALVRVGVEGDVRHTYSANHLLISATR